MQSATLDDVMNPDFWETYQTEIMGCGSFCERFYPVTERLVGRERAKVKHYVGEEHHFWIEILFGLRRFVIDAAFPPSSDTTKFFYVGYLEDCRNARIRRYYENGKYDGVCWKIEEAALSHMSKSSE